ncbi:S8 family serine peptidase [Sphingobium sp. H39-3-25]|uniref:subtilisin-like serine protease QhpE n=1 Tax=Sphingobium arseniciresistens TaxID=3030834 RepID=UPI0023B979DC|nr:S8 family serine peptidase [Sphingobium arseniciresistens]
MPELFAGLSGQGIRIAVVDSGVHSDHPHIAAGQLLEGVAISSQGAVAGDDADATLDRLGHGTAVIAAIQEKAPAALCLPIRVFHEKLQTTATALVAAIDWCIAARVDVINLSLGTVNEAHRPAFEGVAERALDAGILLVAARAANDRLCFPGSLPQAISVGLDWDCPREAYRMQAEGEERVFLASGHPRPIPGVPQRRNLYGISFAVANMTGFAARACEQLGRSAEGRERVSAAGALLEQRMSVAAV